MGYSDKEKEKGNSVGLYDLVLLQLKTTSEEGLKNVWKIRNALGDFDLNLCSKSIYEITNALVKTGLYKEAEIAAQEAFRIIPKFDDEESDDLLEPLQNVCRTLLTVGRKEEALKIARDTKSDINGILLRIVSNWFAEAKEFEKALEIIDEIRDKEQYPYALGDISVALAKAGRLAQTLEVANKISDESTREYYLGEVCRCFCGVGQNAEALGVARSLKLGARQEALFDVADNFAQKGQYSEAKVILSEALDIPYEDHSYSDMRKSQILSEIGEIEEALQVAHIIKKSARRLYALCSLLGVLTRKGQIKEAMNMAQRLPNGEERSKALSTISQTLADSGNIAEAEKIASKVSDPEERSNALASVSRAIAKKAEVKAAFKIINKIPREYKYMSIDTLDILVDVLTRNGRVNESMEIAQLYDPILRVGVMAKVYSLLSAKPYN